MSGLADIHSGPSPQIESEKVALEGQNSAPSLDSDEEYANPTNINEKALIRKLDVRLLPPLTLLYLLSFLDRSNSRFPFCLRQRADADNWE